jgi:hypothetical protein
VRNDERYLAFPPAVSQAFLEVFDLRPQFFFSPLVVVLLLFFFTKNVY